MSGSRTGNSGKKLAGFSRRLGVVAILAALMVYGVFWWVHRRPKPEFSSFETALKAMGYSPFRPPRDDLRPGAIIRLNPTSQELVLASSNLELKGATAGHSLGNMTWKVKLSTDGKGGMDITGLVGDISALGASEAEVTLKDISISSYPLKTLADAVHSHPKALSATALTNPAIVIVSEILVAAGFECDFRTRSNEHIDIKGKANGRWTLDSEFHVSSEGKLVCEQPIPLGFKSHALGSEALDLGPGDFALKVLPSVLSSDQVEHLRQGVAPIQTSSGYQLFAFCLGLGNYRPASLDGSAPSAERVADRLRECLPAETRSQVEAFTTKPASAGSPAVAAPIISRADILKRVDAFVQRNLERMDPSRHAVVIFYYCGHGLSEGISRSAYIVPENVPVGADAAVVNLANQLLDVGELDTHLAPLAENRILLIDGCRKHNDEDQQLLQAAPHVGLDPRQLGDIMKVLQFASGKDGPQPILFGGPDGKSAIPVQSAWCSVEVGPLAERFDRLLTKVSEERQEVSLTEFIRQMQIPVELSDGRQIQAYTSIRDDFLAQLPKPALFHFGPSNIAVRETPYKPEQGFASSPSGTPASKSQPGSGSSGVKARRIGDVHLQNVADFTFSVKEGRIYAADSAGSVWTWAPEDKQPKPVKGDVGFPSLVSDQSSAYLYDGSIRELYLLAVDGPKKISGGYAEFLARGDSGKSVLIVENDHTIGTPDSIRKLPAVPPTDLTNCPSIAQFDTTDVQGLVETEPGRIVYSSTTFGGCLIAKAPDGKEDVLCHGLGQPGPLAEVAGFVYSLDPRGVLYRISPDRKVWSISLTDVGFGNAEALRHITDHGLQALRPDILWVAAGDGVFELDLTHAQWQAFESQ